MLVQQVGEGLVGAQAGVLRVGIDGREVRAEGLESVPVPLLQADDGAVELTFSHAERPPDACAPCQRVHPGQRHEAGEAGRAAVAARERSARPDPRRVDGEGAEEAVDVIGDERVSSARDEPLARGSDDEVLVLAEEQAGHAPATGR